MKKLIFTAAIALTAFAAQANDLVQHKNNKPATFANADVQVINFWAAWCEPCRKEMPDMSKWYAKTGKKQKVEMVGIALDTQENVNKFLREVPVKYPIWRYTGTNSRQMMKSFGNTVGGLPFTVVRAPKCGHEGRILGELTYEILDAAVKRAQTACKK